MSDKGPNQEHFKANYIEVIKRIVPDFYEETEYSLYGEEEDLQYRVLASILATAKNTSSLVGKPTTYNLQVSAFSSNDSYVPYFVPFNNLTNVSPTTYEKYVLRPFGKRFGSFTNKNEFKDFLLASALPHTHFNQVTDFFASSFSSLVDPNAKTVSAVSNTLIDKLGLAYFFNTSGKVVDTASRGLSSFVYSSLADNLFLGKKVLTSTMVSDLFQWMYYNAKGGGAAWDNIRNVYLPAPFSSPSSTYNVDPGKPGNFYASGGQLVSALDTLVNVWVNEDDPNSLYFRDIVNAGLLGMDVTRMENAGPMGKMLKALAYAFYDVKTSVRDIQFLLDIEECPDEFLQYLGRYLGWTFFTDDPAKWRDQLKQAIYLYKAKGTRQALANAVNMVIPSSIYNPNATTSGLQELWESYVPNLIYYTLKTETDLGKNAESYLRFQRGWNQALAASGIKMRVPHYDPQNFDNNVRFAVDAILELLNIKFNFLTIGGTPYKETRFWKSQVARGLPYNQIGYEARNGYLLKIPPWEENRFYQNCFVGPNAEAFLQTLSSVLSRPYESAGAGVSSTAANTVSKYISSSVTIKTGDGINEPGWGANNNFTFMSSSLNLPFNYEKIIRDGDVESMSVFDFWNSKSSQVHTKLAASAIDFSSNDFTNISETRIGRKSIPAIVDIFRQFAPFHALNKIYVGSSTVDDYYGTRSGHDPKQAWSGMNDIEVITTIQSDMDQVKSSYAVSAFPGAWAAGGTFSGVGVYPSIWSPKGGRYIPSASLNGVRGTGTGGYFWSGGVSGTQRGPIDPAPEGQKALIARRTAGRRRNLKYKFNGWAQNREGLNQPVASNFFGMSSSPLPSVLKNTGLKIPGFVPKGFNFSSQNFVDTSGSLSSVYSYYSTSATKFYEFYGSSFFPARVVADTDIAPSSFPAMRDVFGDPIVRALTDIFINRGKVDNRWLRFTSQGYDNFKFGHGVQELYKKYNTTFKRGLHNWVFDDVQVDGQIYGGGFNILSHVFGPGLFNHNLGIKGSIQNLMGTERPFSNTFANVLSGSHPDWSGVVATPAAKNNNVYVNASGGTVTLTDGILQSNAFGTFNNPVDTFEHPSQLFFSNKTLLSGIELVAPNVNTMAVWNNKYNTAYNIDLISASGITLLQRETGATPYQGMRVRYPLNGNINYSYNGKFYYNPKDSALDNAATSSIAGWALHDQNRTPNLNSEGTAYADAAATFVPADSSALPWVQLQSKGGVSGAGGFTNVISGVMGVQKNANLVTVFDPTDRQTPTNLRHLTPKSSYRLTMEVSGTHSTNARMTYALYNKTRNKIWIQNKNYWKDAAATPEDDMANVMPSSVEVSSTSPWKNFYGLIVPSGTFQEGDSYQLSIQGANRSPTANNIFNVRNVQLKAVDASATTKRFAGKEGNKLFPNETYMLGINARVAQIATAGNSRTDESIYVRVVTDPRPFVGNGWTSFANSWAYNWDEKFWRQAGETNTGQWKKLDISKDASGETRFVLEFNTDNARTPLKYTSLSDPYWASAGPVHSDDTTYYIEVAKPNATGEFNGVTLLGVDITNKRYNVYANGYTRKDFVDVFDYFDDLGVSKSSRDARDSSGTYLLSGGSRSEYLEYWGGGHSATNGVYGFREND
jgi:phage tail-like protein